VSWRSLAVVEQNWSTRAPSVDREQRRRRDRVLFDDGQKIAMTRRQYCDAAYRASVLPPAVHAADAFMLHIYYFASQVPRAGSCTTGKAARDYARHLKSTQCWTWDRDENWWESDAIKEYAPQAIRDGGQLYLRMSQQMLSALLIRTGLYISPSHRKAAEMLRRIYGADLITAREGTWLEA